MKRIKERLHRVMILGATPAGIAAANKLGELGIPVTLIDGEPDLDRKLAREEWRLASGMPMNYAHRPGLIRILRNPAIRLILPGTVTSVKHNRQGFQVGVTREPTWVDDDTCIACGKCVETCPVTLEDGTGPIVLTSRQSLPGRPAIDKRKSPLCQEGCPLGVNVQGYVALASRERFQEALAVIRRDNPLPGICGRVCTHPCESECRRGELEGPVAIREIKRFVSDAGLDITDPADQTDSGHIVPLNKHIAVIGSGPAGLTAAWELARNGCRVTVFEKERQAGGLLRYGIGAHRLPREILERELDFIRMFGVSIKTESPIDFGRGLSDLSHEFDGVVAAVGAWKDRLLGVPGEDLDGVEGCVSFLSGYYDGKAIRIPKQVAVIGDGNAAFDLARTLKRAGADVTLISWFSRDRIPADVEEIENALAEGVDIKDSTSVVAFKGDGSTLTHLVVKPTRPGRKPDARGMVWPEVMTGKPSRELAFGCAVVAIGQTGTLDGADACGGLPVNDRGLIDRESTRIKGLQVFAAGDGLTGPGSVVNAMADGRRAARQVLRQVCGIDPGDSPETVRPADREHEPVKADLPEKKPCLKHVVAGDASDFGTWQSQAGLSRKEILYEAGRCLQCGVCSECLACRDVCGPGAVNHLDGAEAMVEQAGTLIVADPDMLPHPVKGDDIIRAYGPANSAVDVHAMMIRGVASAAAAMSLLRSFAPTRRGSGVSYPGPGPVFSRDSIQVGVFVCRCHDSQGWDAALDRVVDEIGTRDLVVHSQTLDSACTPTGISEIIRTVRKKSLNRIVLASCVCCPLNFVCSSCTDQRSRLKEGLFTGTGIDRAMVETCNIRGEALNLLKKKPAQALARFTGLMNRSVRRAVKLRPFTAPSRTYNFTTAVIGASEACLASAEMLAGTGSEVLLFGCGGSPLAIDPGHPNIYAFEGSNVTGMTGSLGNFAITVETGDQVQTFHAGAVIADDRALKQVRYLHQPGLPDRTVIAAVQEKDVTGRPFIFPGMTSVSGLFVADPPGISVSKRQKGAAAAVNAAAVMPRLPRQSKGYTVSVDQKLCRGCGRCVQVCTYQAVTLRPAATGGWASAVDESLCKGCGNCVSVCPTNAADSPYRGQSFLERGLEEILG